MATTTSTSRASGFHVPAVAVALPPDVPALQALLPLGQGGVKRVAL